MKIEQKNRLIFLNTVNEAEAGITPLYKISFLKNSGVIRNTEAHDLCELFRRRSKKENKPTEFQKNTSGGRESRGSDCRLPLGKNLTLSDEPYYKFLLFCRVPALNKSGLKKYPCDRAFPELKQDLLRFREGVWQRSALKCEE